MSLEEPFHDTRISTLRKIGLVDLTEAAIGVEGMFYVRMSTPLLYVLNEILGHLLPKEVFLVNRNYHGLIQEKVHLCSVVCNINALILQEKDAKAITLAEIRKGAHFFPSEDEAAFALPLVKQHSPLLNYKSFPGNLSKEERRNRSDACAALAPPNYKAIDLFFKTEAGNVFFQTRGQELMTKGFGKTYGKAKKTFDAMEDVADSFELPAHQGIAFELLTTRDLSDGDIKALSMRTTPTLVLDRAALKEVMGGVLAGYFERSDAFNEHTQMLVNERDAAVAAKEFNKHTKTRDGQRRAP